MKTKISLIKILLLSQCILCWVSCSKNEDIALIDPSYKTLEVSCGHNFEVPVLTTNWIIESVQEMPSGKNILDKNHNPLALDGNGKVEASNGWLALTRDNENGFIINLKENFDKSKERKFVICINEAGKQDYMTVIQKAGTEYKLVKSEYKEIEEQREIYTSDEECSDLTLTNNSSKAVWEPCGYIFKNVVNSSEFESDDYGAFDWASEQEVEIRTPELILEGFSWGTFICNYKKGVTTIPYIKDIPNGNKILVQPHSRIYLKGEITYCKRIFNYTFTIQNEGTGSRFDVSGICTQIMPISSNTISYDK